MMTLTKEDLQAIRELMQEETVPINNRLATLDDRIDSIDCKIASLEQLTTVTHHSVLRIENEQFLRISAALDGHIDLRRTSDTNEVRIDNLEKRVDRLELKRA